jgi:hypothetical protein
MYQYDDRLLALEQRAEPDRIARLVKHVEACCFGKNII